jgi:hypothetical protein
MTPYKIWRKFPTCGWNFLSGFSRKLVAENIPLSWELSAEYIRVPVYYSIEDILHKLKDITKIAQGTGIIFGIGEDVDCLQTTNFEDLKPKQLPKSQKIIGLEALRNSHFLWSYLNLFVVKIHYLLNDEDINKWQIFPTFARGCPLRPRHGFVDSKVVKNSVELKAVWDAVRAEDPEGEMLVGTYLPSILNYVWTPNSLTVGTGHDGATAGKGSMMLPLVKGEFINHPNYQDLISKAFIAGGEVPYIEAVLSSNEIYLTQCRSGPEINSLSPDYIPELMRVETIVEADGDLIEWEKKAASFTPGTVVYHPGGTLASHYSVHAVVHKIPVMITRKPVVGEILEPTQEVEDINPELFKKGIVAGFMSPLQDTKNRTRAGQFIIFSLHNSAAQRGEYSWMLGAAAAMMARLGLALSLGEVRHNDNANFLPKLKNETRDQIYHLVMNDYFVYRLLFSQVIESFRNIKWQSGYGGPAWGDCAAATAKLDTAILNVMKSDSEVAITELCDQLNKAVNSAHNGGWWFNKINVDQQELNNASNGHMATALKAGYTSYEIYSLVKINSGKDTVFPLLRFLPLIKDEIPARRVKIQTAVVMPSGKDVPQIYDLTYPKVYEEPKEEFDIDLKSMHIRDLEGSFRVRYQMKMSINGINHWIESDCVVPEKVYEEIKNTPKLQPSFAGTSALYAPLANIVWKFSEHSSQIEITGWWNATEFKLHYALEKAVNKKKKLPVLWWKPGVKIPVKWTADYITTYVETEDYVGNNPNASKTKECSSCGDSHNNKENWCDSCKEDSEEIFTCDDCGGSFNEEDLCGGLCDDCTPDPSGEEEE